MGLRNLLVYTTILATASSQSFDDPWLRDPLLVGLWKLTRAINSVGFNLFEDLSFAMEGNVLICPYSISASLGILHFGSAGETEKELADVLGYEAVSLTKDEAAQIFYMLSTKHLTSSNRKFYLFDAPRTIVLNRKNGLLPTFQRIVEVLFQTPITVAGFTESAVELARSVNDWVAARTRNKIPDILEYIDPYCDVIVLSAAFFKGMWIHKFPPQETQPGIFYNFGSLSRSKEVHMMRMTNILNYHSDQDVSILELPFKSRNVSMIILLPKKLDGIDELHSKFYPEFFEEQMSKMTPSDVEIVLPKFKFDFGADLTGSLRWLGVKTMFDPEKMDLSEMIRRDSIIFGEVVHRTTVSVTEKGVEVSAAAKVSSSSPIPPVLDIPDFHADHPFLFVIYERRIKMILLVGRVMEL